MRLKQLVTETRRRRAAVEVLRRARTRDRHDARTGLSTFALIDAHLRTHLEAFKQSGRALSAGLMKIVSSDLALSGPDMQALSEQIGSLIARLIRAEDMAAMTSQTSVAFLFPATLEVSAQAALKRISAVLRATRFHSPRIVDGVAVEVDWTVLQPREGQTGAELWDVGDADRAAGEGNGV
jgi:two-component system cell cycle response regulator PopA